jgi:hypothetical protein
MVTKQYRWKVEPSGTAYRELIAFCGSLATELLLVVREDMETGARVAAVLDQLQPYLRRCTRERAWPGTELLGSGALVYRYAVHPSSLRLLSTMNTRLFDWVQPKAPEDLSFTRSTGEPILVTTAHESEGHLLLTDAELADLEARCPHLEPCLMRPRS